MRWIAVAAVLVVWFLCLTLRAPKIQADIDHRVRARLQSASVPAERLFVDGRDVFLTGPIASEDLKRKAGEAAEAVAGVRVVRNLFVVSAPVSRTQVSRQAIERSISDAIAGRNVQFEAGSANLTEAGRSVLNDVAAALRTHSDAHIEVQGHTDSSGDTESNRRLSQQRAEVVVRYRVENQIATDRLIAHGYGPDRPVADNRTPEGRIQNRRVEFHVK